MLVTVTFLIVCAALDTSGSHMEVPRRYTTYYKATLSNSSSTGRLLPLDIEMIEGLPPNKDATEESFNPRIVGGRQTIIYKHPFQVSLQSNHLHICSGSIISASFVLTAAHCLKDRSPRDYSVRVGTKFAERGGFLHRVDKIIKHPRYDADKLDYDIALLRVTTPFKFTKSVQPAHLADECDKLREEEVATVTGWGHIWESGPYSSVLQEVTTSLISNAQCSELHYPPITPRMLCAEDRRDTCIGDSGGPLVTKKQVGIVSWGFGCNRRRKPTVYTRIAAVRDWIARNSDVSGNRNNC